MRKRFSKIIIVGLLISLLTGCSSGNKIDSSKEAYNGRTFYEVFVRAFNDSNGDGIGDLNGLTAKLDYLKDLGIGGIWLMPINDSPSYHGYDVKDYYKINPDYGTEEDLKKLLEEAKKKDIKIYMDMVINHTSSEHPWFKEAREDKNSKYRDYYTFTESQEETTKKSPMGTRPWAKNGDKDEYYYGIFWSGMPDLNFDNKQVRQEVKDIAKYYIDMGLDGFRVDAAKWIYNETDKNIEFWQDYTKYCKSLKKDFGIVGEVWDNLYGMAPYQNCLDSIFDFTVGENVLKGVDSGSIENIPEKIKDNYEVLTEENKNFTLAPFLTNHDGDRAINKLFDGAVKANEKMKMAATIYLSLPGTPFLYYGEEIGMKGSKPDEMIREPFIWDNKDTKQNTSWEKITNNIDEVALSVEKDDKNSIYNFYKSLLKVRNEHKAMRDGTVEGVETGNRGLLHMNRKYKKENIEILINSTGVDASCDLKKGKYDVLLSNKDKTDEFKSSGEVELKGGEILILNKR